MDVPQKKKILLVDDVPNIAKTVKTRLEANNYEVLVVEDTKTALEQIAQYNPHLIISDTLGEEGYGLCRKLKSDPEYKRIPFMFLSAQAQKKYIEKGYSVGADLYVTKPYDSEELLANIKQLLNKN